MPHSIVCLFSGDRKVLWAKFLGILMPLGASDRVFPGEVAAVSEIESMIQMLANTLVAGTKVAGECTDIYLQGRIEPVFGDVTILAETC